MSNIWFTSDTHYGHKNIVKGTTDWDNPGNQECRDFDTMEEHNQALIDGINNNVKESDILYHLGDWSFGGLQNILLFREQINCQNIHLIFGNHDHHIINNKIFHESHNGSLRAKHLFKSTQQYFSGKIGGQQMFLIHYSMRVWEKSHHGAWNLYGHSHGTLPDYFSFSVEADTGVITRNAYKAMDVGVDTHPEFRPYHFDEIKAIMDKREVLRIDHHNAQTN